MKQIARRALGTIPPELQVLILGYCSLIVLFAMWRLVFLTYFADAFRSEHLVLYARAFVVALRLDSLMAADILVPIALLIHLPVLGWPLRGLRVGMVVYLAAICAAICVLSSVDLEWFNEFGSHVNAMVVAYGAEGSEVYESLWESYPIWLHALGWIAIVALFTWGLSSRLAGIARAGKSGATVRVFTFAGSALVLYILARGGTQERPVNWGHAHFSRDHMANMLAQNPTYFLLRSLIEYSAERDVSNALAEIDELEARRIVDRLRRGSDAGTGGRQRAMMPSGSERRPNVMLVVLESFVSENCDFLNPALDEPITPNLARLAREGISFSRCFANGIRSAFGLGSLLTSLPALPGKPIISQVESSFDGNAAGRATRIFRDLGYSNLFVCGGDAGFDNMEGFAIANGFDRVVDWNDDPLADKPSGTMWGKYDHHLFEGVLELIGEVSRPFFMVVFTTTNHEPFHVPEEYEDRIADVGIGPRKHERAKRTMAYVDRVIAEFMESARAQPWFENTLFVFTADHGLGIHREIRNHPMNGHIPLVFYSEGLEGGGLEIDKIVSQVDVIPTVLDLIGEGGRADGLFGVSGLRAGKGLACRTSDRDIQWIEEGLVYSEALGAGSGTLYRNKGIWDLPYALAGPDEDEIAAVPRRTSRAYMRTAFATFKRGAASSGR